MHVKCMSTLSESMPALSVRWDRPLEDCTVYELLAHGAKNEWDSLEMASLRKNEKKGWLRAFYKDGERKAFLKSRGKVNRYYLLALLTHGDHKRPVPHGQNNNNVYRALMGMTTTTRRKETLQTIGWMDEECSNKVC